MRRLPPHRLSLWLLLGATALLYLWGLGASGWANAYYSAAAQAGAASWKALLFGATDAAGGITVDKTPASVWVMALSARLFGVNTWSILVPQALMGVASVGLLYATVRRWSSPAAALLSGAVLALTPVAVLIFRFNNPDSLLVLLLVAGAYATVRAIDSGHLRWLMLAGACVGFAFLTKMLQAFLVLPAFGGAYLLAARGSVRQRVAHVGAALGAMIVAGGWWVALVELWPAGSRPYIGGSQTNSVLELTLGYNGLGRLTGDEVGSVGPGSWGWPGWARLFGPEMADQIAWLLPAAVLLLCTGLWVTRRAPLTDRTRAALVLWGGWLVVTGVVFSLMSGIIHAYYTIALAPAIAALSGIGVTLLWQRRSDAGAAGVLSAALALTALEAYLLLGWLPILFVGLVLAVGLFLAPDLPGRARRLVGTLAVLTALAGPAWYSFVTAATPHTGAIPSAGPGFGGGGVRLAGGLLDSPAPGAALVSLLRQDSAKYRWTAATVGSNNAAGYQLGSGVPVLAIGGFNGTDPAPTLAQFQSYVHNGLIHYFLGDAGTSSTSTGGSDAGRQIADWVAENYESSTVDGVTVYDVS